MYYGYAIYQDGRCICHCYGTLDDVKKSEERVKASGKMAVIKFDRKAE
jgi:hypothetical protein